MRIAVAGNPNAGKTTLFNRLTGARAKVANYPGVTVERREASLRLASGNTARVIDLPGCYTLTARSPEEEIAHHVLVGAYGEAQPDLVVCVVDATSLSRGLFLALQLIEMGVPVLVALNMIDVARQRGIEIDVPALSSRLGVPVVTTDARSGEGTADLLGLLDSSRSAANADIDAKLTLSERDRRAVDRVRSELRRHGRHDSVGNSLWLLTSDLGLVKPPLADELRLLIDQQLSEIDDGTEEESFVRRLIAARYRAVDELLDGAVKIPEQQPETTTDRIDRVLLHPVAGFGVFAITMIVLFQAVFSWADPMIGWVEDGMGWLAAGLESLIPAGLVRSLFVNGVVAGIGNVLVFLPQIALLFLGITVLEESGYMARAAFMLDRLMRRVGLNGKAFIPLMSSFACAIPGVMAARTVESRRDRLVTIMVAPFMSCSARLPVYVLVIAAVLATAEPVLGLSIGGLVIAAMYFLGFAAAIATAWLLKRTVLPAPTPPLLLELPPYRLPLWKTVGQRVWSRCRVFVIQTGTIILALSILLWGLLTFPRVGMDPATYEAQALAIEQRAAIEGLGAEDIEGLYAALERRDAAVRLDNSIGGWVGHSIEPLIEPLGFDWRIGIGLVASFAAREVLVSTLGQVFALGAEVEPESPALRDALLADVDPVTGKPRFSPLVGLSLMVFFVLAMQCLSTVATVKRETNSWRWPLAQLVYMNTLAYVASLLVFQGGRALGFG